VPIHRRDELGQLGAAMNAMAANVERLTGELLRARDQLAQTSQTQREFIALASHELSGPVSSLRTYAEALLYPDIITDEEERHYSLQRIEHLSIRLGAIVRNLLSASRIRAGQLQVECGATDLAAIVHGCVEDCLRQEPATRIAMDLPDTLPRVVADAVCLEEILANLLSNAVRYTPSGSPVQVAAEEVSRNEAAWVRIHVSDQGPGLSAEQQSRLFQRFGRIDSRSPTAGLGLGLYICHAYATAMGGRIWVTSAPGQGATFTVELPSLAMTGVERVAAG
jgi:signal transduction histidine kinase